MNQLPMPSDVKRGRSGSAGQPMPPPAPVPAGQQPLIEPPSAKLIVRLFLIPLLIVAAAVGVMWLVGLLAGGQPTTEEILARLRRPGGERTADLLVGPGAKQRYLDAKALVDTMKTPGTMTEAYRVDLADDLIDILRNHTRPGEGEIRHFLLLALGRAWQIHPSQPPMDSPEAVASRQRTVRTLMEYGRSSDLSEQKAAILALAYLAGHEEVDEAIPFLVERLADPNEELDVRLSAATVLGPVGDPADQRVIDALERATQESDPRNAELVWSASLSLAQLGQEQVASTILMLLSRDELSELRVYDRETDPQNPQFRPLSEHEQQRYLINTMIGAQNLDVPAVQARLREIRESDPSRRVRTAATEILGTDDTGAVAPSAP